MHPSPRFGRRTSGFGILQLMVVLVVMGILTTLVVQSLPDTFARAKDLSLGQRAAALNRSSIQFVSTGGEFPANVSADQALQLLQTPVDELSKKAGFGNFEVVEPSVTLRSATEDGAPRLIFKYDVSKKRPVWAVAEVGSGFVIENDSSRAAPPTANWSARVDRAGQTLARQSKWVWDYDGTAKGGQNPGQNVSDDLNGPGNPPVTATLWIDGSFKITVPGTYYWTGNSTQSGSLNISVDGNTRTSSDATQVQSIPRTFVAGDSGSVVVTLQRGEGGTVSQVVEINIPLPPTVEIAGPDTVLTLDAVQWTATSSVSATPIRIKIQDGAEASANDSKSISTALTAFPAGTKKTIIVSASALNSSGMARASKTVLLDVVAPPKAEWILPPELTTGSIEARGTYTFIFRTTAGGPGKLDVESMPMGAPMYGGDPGILPEPTSGSAASAMEIPVTVNLSQLTAAVRYAGVIRLTGKFQNAVDTITVTKDIPVDILRSEMMFNWTLTVTSPSTRTADIEAFRIVVFKDGAPLHYFDGPGGLRSFTISPLLPQGEYSVQGGVQVRGAPYSAHNILNLTVAP